MRPKLVDEKNRGQGAVECELPEQRPTGYSRRQCNKHCSPSRSNTIITMRRNAPATWRSGIFPRAGTKAVAWLLLLRGRTRLALPGRGAENCLLELPPPAGIARLQKSSHQPRAGGIEPGMSGGQSPGPVFAQGRQGPSLRCVRATRENLTGPELIYVWSRIRLVFVLRGQMSKAQWNYVR